jgi:hypothetical protein
MIQTISTNIPREFRLYQNYPNPFNPLTKIRFDIPRNGKNSFIKVKLIVFDKYGREISTLINQSLTPGSYKINLDASKYSPGYYYYKMLSGRFTDMKRMVVI